MIADLRRVELVPWLHYALAMFLLFSAPAVCAGQKTTKTGEYFRVICHFENDKVAVEALKTAEMVWPEAAKLLGISDRAPEKPAEIHLFRTIKDYEKMDSELTGGKFQRNLAFSHWDTQASYILLQPDCSDETLKIVGLPVLTRRLTAHEATHLVRYVSIPNHRAHPRWLSDGVATWVEEKVMTNGRWSPGVEDDPDMSTMILQTIALIEKGDLPSVKYILRDRIDDVDWQTRYALRWLLLRFLKNFVDRKTFRSIMGEARRLRAGSDYSRRLNSFIEGALGREAMKTIDAKFKAYLRSLTPQWDEVYRSLETAGRSWTQIAFPDKNAISWRTEPVGKDEYALEGKFKILPNRKQQLNLLLGRNHDGFVSVAFAAGSGVTIFNYHAKENRWEKLGSAKSDVLQRERWMRFRAEVGNDQIRVTLNKKLILTVSLSGRSMRGPWGLGAQNGSAVKWRKVGLK